MFRSLSLVVNLKCDPLRFGRAFVFACSTIGKMKRASINNRQLRWQLNANST